MASVRCCVRAAVLWCCGGRPERVRQPVCSPIADAGGLWRALTGWGGAGRAQQKGAMGGRADVEAEGRGEEEEEEGEEEEDGGGCREICEVERKGDEMRWGVGTRREPQPLGTRRSQGLRGNSLVAPLPAAACPEVRQRPAPSDGAGCGLRAAGLGGLSTVASCCICRLRLHRLLPLALALALALLLPLPLPMPVPVPSYSARLSVCIRPRPRAVLVVTYVPYVSEGTRSSWGAGICVRPLPPSPLPPTPTPTLFRCWQPGSLVAWWPGALMPDS